MSGAVRAFRSAALRRHNIGHIQAAFDAAPSGCIILAGDSHASHLPRVLAPRTVLNAGIAGATVRSYNRALDLLRQPLPGSLAVLIIGTNDIRHRSALSKAATDEFFRQAVRIVERLQTWTLDPYVTALPPTPVSMASERDPETVEVYSELLRAVSEYRGVSFCDPFTSLRGARFGLSEDDAFIDGVRLRDYGAIALQIEAHIRGHCRPERYLECSLPGFDADYYRNWYPDTSRYPLGPTRHYLDFGWREGRDPSGQFSTDGYLNANPDVRAADVNPLVHFLEVGLLQGRTGWQKSHPHPTRYGRVDN
ncbi:SGNH/GDSL hydrolase family protein [Methylobacterium sp. P5_C11]